MLRHKAQFIAAFAGKSVLISLLVENSSKIELVPGANYRFIGFTGIYDFSFNASVLQLEGAQLGARMSYPDVVRVKFVYHQAQPNLDATDRAALDNHNMRTHLRAGIIIPSTVATDQESAAPVIIRDLSASGACLDVGALPVKVGESIKLLTPVEYNRKKQVLNLLSSIKHSRMLDNDHGMRIGVEFVNISQSEKLALHIYVNSIAKASDFSRHNFSG